MAIKYLSNVNIDGTLTLTVNADADSTYTGIVVSESGLLKYRTKAQIKSDIGAGSGDMDNFIAAATTGSNSTISNGDTLTIAAGTGITTTNNANGTITIAATGSGQMSSWDIGSTTGTDQTVSDGELVNIVGGTKISGSIGGTRTVTLAHDAQSQSDSTSTGSLASGGTFDVPTVSVDSTGHVTGTDTKTITIGSFDNYTGWKLDAESSGSVLSVGSGATVDFIGGTGISTSKASGPNLTITNDLPFNNIGTAGDSGSSTISNQGTITIAGGTGISTVDNGSGTITITASGSGTMSSFDIASSPSTTTQTIQDGNTLTFVGATSGSDHAGILPKIQATDEVLLDLDFDQLTTVTSVDPSADFLIGLDGSQNEKILYENVHLDQWGKAEADVDFGTNKLTNVKTGTASTDGVNLGQVQTLIAGVGVFKGGYNANTGLTTDLGADNGSLDGASNIALDLGDFFVVTTAGTAFYSETLEVGDLIFANQDISASSSPAQTVYTVVIQDQNIAGAGATDGATQKGVAGFDSANFDVTANGFVTLDDSGATAGSFGGTSKSLSATVTGKGLLTALSEQTIDITASQVSDFCSAVSTCIGANEQYSELIGTGSTPTTYTVNHQLGTDVMVQLYDTSTGDTVYAETVRTAANSGTVTISTNSAIANNGVKVLVTKVS